MDLPSEDDVAEARRRQVAPSAQAGHAILAPDATMPGGRPTAEQSQRG